MSDDTEFGEAVAESTVGDEQLRLDPTYFTDDGQEPAPVWPKSQHLRELIERQEALPPAADRRLLENSLPRQVHTLGLYREVVRILTGPLDPRATVSLFVLLFPGQARDNTGIKELNDKVIGAELNSRFIIARQQEIERLFPRSGTGTGPRFVTVGQDYKTASIVAVGRTPQEFAAQLVRLDAALRDQLLRILAEAEKGTSDAKRLVEIRKLRRTLERDPKYRFDFLFGANTLPVRGKAVDVTFQLLTEALKGAGVARFAAKVANLKTRLARQVADQRADQRQPKGSDPRGRTFESATFLAVARAVDDIKKVVSKAPDRDGLTDLQSVYVDTVWTVAFVTRSRLLFGNPDVVRDVRKKALTPPPPLRAGPKVSFPAQLDLLELWLVAVNLIDFIIDFTVAEYPKHVESHHVEALLAVEELSAPDKPINWPRLARLLTRDIRQTFDPVAVLGSTSEFQFYSYPSDFSEQIFLVMDIRDLGVDLMAYYEAANITIVDGKLTGRELMLQTVRAVEAIVARRRFTYDQVVAVLRRYHQLAARSGGRAAAEKAFGTALRTDGPIRAFRDSVRVMLGGDEIFVAAHPYFAKFVTQIIADLDAIAVNPDQPLNMRSVVVYSVAERVPAAAAPGGPSTGPGISPTQRKANQIAHDRSLKLAADAPETLKGLERTQRRIERLIDMLEANPKKSHLAAEHRRRLDALRLTRLYARARHGHATPLTDNLYTRLRQLLRAGDLVGAQKTGQFELVDFADSVVDASSLRDQAARLEADVRRDVGIDNVRFEAPLITKLPKWIQKLIDTLIPPERLT